MGVGVHGGEWVYRDGWESMYVCGGVHRGEWVYVCGGVY